MKQLILQKTIILPLFFLLACGGGSEDPEDPTPPDPVTNTAKFNLVKTTETTSISTPSTLTYSYTFKNTGNVELSDLTLSDSGIDNSSLSGCPIAKLAVNAEASCSATYTVTQEDIDSGNALSSSAIATAKDSSGNAVTENDTSDNNTSVSVIQNPKLELTMSAATLSNDADNNGLITSGDVLSYTITATNSGNITQKNIVILSESLSPNEQNCESVIPGQTCTLRGDYLVTMQDATTGEINLSSTATSEQQTSQITANSMSDIQNVQLELTMSAATLSNDADNNSLITSGDTLTYTITVTNSGSVTHNSVVIMSDRLSPNTKSCASLSARQTCILSGNYLVTAQDATAGEINLISTVTSDQQTSQLQTNKTTAVSAGATSELRRLTDGMNFNQCHFKPTNNMARKNQPSRPLVIKHGWDLPNSSYLTKNNGTAEQAFVDQIKERNFDGVTFSLGGVSHSIGPGTYSEAQAEAAMAHFDAVNLGDVNENMIMLYTHKAGNGYAKEGYRQVIENLRNLAKAAKKRNNVKGILLDTEFYPSNTHGNIDPWDYSADICEGYTSAEKGKANGFSSQEAKDKCDIQAYNRGYEAMQAMVSEWPDLKLITLFGIWTDDPRTFNLVNGAWGNPNTGFAPHYEWHHSQGVMPHFLAGMFAATICTDATFTDGTELYGLRELSDFEKTGQFITNGIVDNNPFLPDNIKEAYRAEVGLGFGVYDDHFAVFARHDKFPIPKMQPNEWETTIKNAGKVATHYVWLYTERHDWWGKDPNPWPETKVEVEPEWITTTDNAVRAIKAQ